MSFLYNQRAPQNINTTEYSLASLMELIFHQKGIKKLNYT